MADSPATTTTADVAVIGAGPAGAAAAISLARAGLEVVLADKATFPRDKCCGDGLTTGALRLLEQLGLDLTVLRPMAIVESIRITAPPGPEICFPLPSDDGTFVATVPRMQLDHAMVELARDSGVRVLEGHPLRAVDQGPWSIDVELGGPAGREVVRAGHAIGADGAWSALRRHLGAAEPGYRGEWHALRQYLHPCGPRATEGLFVWFEPDILPGYVWSFPMGDGTVNAGYGILRGGSFDVSAMGHLWSEILSRPHIREVLGADLSAAGPVRCWPVPTRIHRSVLCTDRALFVGDAIGATDPLTGEGIGQALQTGIWAAEAIVRAGTHDPQKAGALYRNSVRRGMYADHRMSRALLRLVSHHPGARFAVGAAGMSDWTRRNFARWLFEDYPRAVLFTPGRWHRGMFTGSGVAAGGSCPMKPRS